MMTGIYLITNLINGQVYMGSCARKCGVEGRLSEHRNGHRSSPHLKNAIKKYGVENFSFEVLEYCPPELCIEREQYWIDFFKDWLGWDMLYNISPTAGSPLGVKRPDVSISNAKRIGKKHPNYGRKCPEHAKRMSGRKHSEKTKKKMSEARKAYWDNRRDT